MEFPASIFFKEKKTSKTHTHTQFSAIANLNNALNPIKVGKSCMHVIYFSCQWHQES